MRILYSITGLCLLLGLCGCSSYKAKKEESFLNVPELGSLVGSRENMMYKTYEQVGLPLWEKPPKVYIQELPFNKSSYSNYNEYINKSGQISTVAYADSLPYKPKYLRLQLLDKIGLAALLNSDLNKETRDYLQKDDAYTMVTSLDIITTDLIMPQLLSSETVLLEQDKYKNLSLRLLNGKEEQLISFIELQVFDYGLSCFCWGQNQFYHKVIQAVIDADEKCPEGTEKNANKLDSGREYLKL